MAEKDKQKKPSGSGKSQRVQIKSVRKSITYSHL